MAWRGIHLRLIVIFAALSLVVSGCSAVEGLFVAPPSGLSVDLIEDRLDVVSLRVTSEAGVPLSGATLEIETESHLADDHGVIRLELRSPVAGVLRADGFLDEPVVVSGSDPEMDVAMWARVGANGLTRSSHHYGGDVMLGRRYLEPSRADTPIVDPDDPDTAHEVVAAVDDLFAAADLSVVNLETVISDDPGEPYPGKRFLLSSPSVITEMLHRMGVDLVTLGNNHLNDWEDAGVVSTIENLDEAQITYAGAGLTPDRAEEGAVVATAGGSVGILSYTTVTGDFVNDSLPDADEIRPSGLPADETWQFEERIFGYDGLIDTEPRRAGEMWRVFQDIEADLPEATISDLWSAVRDVYPELQDWVARRGHGGAAHFSRSSVEEGVADLRSQGADIVVVQLHAGFQFSESPSTFVREAAKASVDAGADLVIGHHPHVVQGFETYRGKLIAFSLGNFVFDQDFLSTFPTMFLRVIYEGDEMVEARVYPVLLDDYRPVPAAGVGAETIIELIDFRSRGLHAAKRVDGAVVQVEGGRDLEGLAGVGLEMDGDSALLRFDDASALETSGWHGGDLLLWGDMEDVTADGRDFGGPMWNLASDDLERSAIAVSDAPSGQWVLNVRSGPREGDTTWARPVARVGRVEHRKFNENGVPIDKPPSYRFETKMRFENGTPMVRFDVYHFEDTDPTQDPVSDLIRRVELPLESVSDASWEQVELQLPPDLFASDGGRQANAVMIYVGIVSDGGREAEVLFDQIRLIETR